MLITCGICGKEIEVDDSVKDGQHVSCPFCGHKSAISRPSRIELPTGLAARRVTPAPAAEPPPTEAPKMRVIRQDAPSNDPFRDRRLRETEERARVFEEHRTQEFRRRAISRIVNIALLFVVLLAAGVGFLIWNSHRNNQERQRIEMLQEQQRAEQALFEQRQQQELARQEAETKRKLEELERQNREKAIREEERQKREAETKRLAEEHKLEREKRAKAEGEARAAVEMYRQALQVFRCGSFGFLNSVPEDMRPGKAEGEFFYLLPFSNHPELVVTVAKSGKDGITEVYDLHADGSRTPREAQGFLTSLDGRDYLVAAGDVVCFHSKRRKQHVGVIGKKEPAVLADEFFGDLAPEIKKLRPSYEELSFEVVFMPAGAKKPIIVKNNVELGMGYEMEEIREAIAEAFPQKNATKLNFRNQKRKKFKRTVVFWDGAMIKTGIDGITYVPRVPPLSTMSGNYGTTRIWGAGWDYERHLRHREKRYARAQHNLARYEALKAEAEKQDQAEAEYNAGLVDNNANLSKKAKDAADQAYAERLQRIYKDGQLFFRARISEPAALE